MPDRLTPDERSKLMARVRTRDTAPEVELRRALYAAGVRGWRLHRPLPGKPDLVFARARLAVFVDGAFWHGHPDYYRGQSGDSGTRRSSGTGNATRGSAGNFDRPVGGCCGCGISRSSETARAASAACVKLFRVPDLVRRILRRNPFVDLAASTGSDVIC